LYQPVVPGIVSMGGGLVEEGLRPTGAPAVQLASAPLSSL
jgi:hypothetical protein